METAGNKHVSHESEQSNTNNNINNNISNERPVQPVCISNEVVVQLFKDFN